MNILKKQFFCILASEKNCTKDQTLKELVIPQSSCGNTVSPKKKFLVSPVITQSHDEEGKDVRFSSSKPLTPNKKKVSSLKIKIPGRSEKNMKRKKSKSTSVTPSSEKRNSHFNFQTTDNHLTTAKKGKREYLSETNSNNSEQAPKFHKTVNRELAVQDLVNNCVADKESHNAEFQQMITSHHDQSLLSPIAVQENNDIDFSTIFKTTEPHHGITPEMVQLYLQLQCRKCSGAFLTYNSFVKHLKLHIKRYACVDCEEEFKDRDDLKQHQMEHMQYGGNTTHSNNDQIETKFWVESNSGLVSKNTVSSEPNTSLAGKTCSDSIICKHCKIRFQTQVEVQKHTCSQYDDLMRTLGTTPTNSNSTNRVRTNNINDIIKNNHKHTNNNSNQVTEVSLNPETTVKSSSTNQSNSSTDTERIHYHLVSRMEAKDNNCNNNIDTGKNINNSKNNTNNRNTNNTSNNNNNNNSNNNNNNNNNDNRNLYQCPTCQKKLKSKHTLFNHLLLHEEPTFKCDLCQQRFHRNAYLAKHTPKCPALKNPVNGLTNEKHTGRDCKNMLFFCFLEYSVFTKKQNVVE